MVLRQLPLRDQAIECGPDARSHFLFDNAYLNMNHGSFGAIPKEVRDVQRHYQEACEQQPDIFLRYTLPPLLYASRTAIAKYFSCPTSNIVYVPNATTGLNTVLRDLRFQPGDVAIYYSTIYGAIEKTLLYLTETTPMQVHRIELVHPLSDSAVVDLFSTALATLRSQGLNPKLAVFDTVSSLPAVRIPFESLTALCRTEGVLSVVDAAHGAGHIPLDLPALDPDFLTTNLHKWLHVPRPCAVLYVPKRNQRLVRTSIPTSHGFVPRGVGKVNNPLPRGKHPLSEFEGNFEFVGTQDPSSYLSVDAALQWRGRFIWDGKTGEEAIMGYCMQQARDGGRLVADLLATKVLENDEGTLACCMVNIALPIDYEALFGRADLEFDKIIAVARWIEKVLVDEHRTFVAIIWHGGAWLVRLSAQVYLTLDDWQTTGAWIKQVCERARGRKW